MDELCLSKVLIHLKMTMRRLGKAKDVFIHFQPLIAAGEKLILRRTIKNAPRV
jgi:hypothetical protein